ncbi:MAG: hypothetical protein JWN94_1793 [Betaproteobacteria bacterium]|nr:hypothetical protein [Betaproteobacteria bacterium]
MIRLLGGLLLSASVAAFAAEPVRIIETRSVPQKQLPAPPAATYELNLSLYTFKDSEWKPNDVITSVLDALPMIAQCGVAVASVELRVLEAPRKYFFYSVPVAREMLREFTVTKPAILFVDDTHSEPAYDAEAIGLSNARERPEMSNTIWLAFGTHDLHLAVAHELVHVLSDSGEHSDAPENLMRPRTGSTNTRLTGEQCERLRVVAAANGLIAPRAPAKPQK